MKKTVSFLLGIYLCLFFNANILADIQLPDMGDTSGNIISPEEERQLGEAFMRELRRAVAINEDPESVEYIQSLGYRIAAQTQSPMNFTFFIVDSPVINAFAAPGGYIGIHSGLILETQTESELASVLAHETAHVTQRHLPRAFEQASKLSLPTAAALIAAIILAQNNPEVAHAAITTSIASAQQSMINFTRANEKEADNVGMQYLAAAGFNPMGMPVFFSRLHKAHRYYTNKLPEYLNTHPITLSRIAESKSRAEQLPPSRDKSHESFYPLLRAKLRIYADKSGIDSLAYYKNQLAENNDTTSRYGYALALMKTNQANRAEKHAQQLLEEQPEHSAFIHLFAKIKIKQGQYGKAIATLEKALKIYPRHYPLTMLLAEALIDNQQAFEAQRLLLDQIYYRKPTPSLYQLFAKATNDLGLQAESHEALAEYHYQQGAIAMAINQIESALKVADPNNFHLISRLEARKTELTYELKLRTNKH